MAEHSGQCSAWERRLATAFGAALLLRVLFPFFDSPLSHLFSDPLRHWDNARDFLHPTITGASDPYGYQLYLFALRRLAGASSAGVLTGCGFLCALMPYGWYRAMRELRTRRVSLMTALVIALLPAFIGPYAYFMTETLLLTLTGFAFWLTLRAHRKRSVAAFATAGAFWLATGFTRILMLPLAALCLLWLWLPQPQRPIKAAIGAALLAAIAIPAGLHARAALGYFAPLGNLYLNATYRASGRKDIQIDYGRQGLYSFGSPSYYNPTFYPFSNWTTSRRGVVAIRIDTRHGRADWQREERRVGRDAAQPWWRDEAEMLLYLFFGQSWPDNDRSTLCGLLTVWTRWLWPPAIACVAVGAARRSFRGSEWILVSCALAGLALLALQTEGIMEGRFRKPLDPIFVAALALQFSARGRTGGAAMPDRQSALA